MPSAKMILDKVEAGQLDIVPDEMGLNMFNIWKEEPSKLVEMFHQIYYKE